MTSQQVRTDDLGLHRLDAPVHRANTADENRIRSLVATLRDTYGTPSLRHHTNPIDEVVCTILSTRTTETRYTVAFQRLRSAYAHWHAVLESDTEELASLLYFTGMGRRKADLIKRCLDTIVLRFGDLDLSSLCEMSHPQAEAVLSALPGLGPKSARRILLHCFHRRVLPVDIHTYRVAIRLGIISRRVTYEQSHTLLQDAIPPNLRRTFHLTAITHGRTRCHARRPDCVGCPLFAHCTWPKATRPIPIRAREKHLAIDLFSGAGGMTLGFTHAGFEVVQAVDSDKHAAATYSTNHPTVDFLNDDLRCLNPASCLRRLGIRPGELTLLMGGPPCQGFSESNRRTRTLANPQNHLYKTFLHFVSTMMPAWVVVENVAGLRTVARGDILHRILHQLHALGYIANWQELNAVDYGVPQVRRRLFVLANRIGAKIPLIHRIRSFRPSSFRTVRDALSDLPKLDNGARSSILSYRDDITPSTYARSMRGETTCATVSGNVVTRNAPYIITRYSHIPPGGNWKDIPHDLLANYKDYTRCHTGIYYRLVWEEPAKVIGNFRKNMLIHPSQNRGLSVREAARLQSIPDAYDFRGSIGYQQQQVADAVPPLLAKSVGTGILVTDRQRGVL